VMYFLMVGRAVVMRRDPERRRGGSNNSHSL
jgi:hypothetical protein